MRPRLLPGPELRVLTRTHIHKPPLRIGLLSTGLLSTQRWRDNRECPLSAFHPKRTYVIVIIRIGYYRQNQ
jgi:hypothetical protein